MIIKSKEITIFIIAGESSGDIYGARLIEELKNKSDLQIKFHGIGGKEMVKAGLHSLFPMEEISLMGFLEIIPHISRLLRRINETVEAIKNLHPDIVITIDSPGFNFRVVKKLQNFGIKLVHYVAPSVWAYKPKRAAKVAKLYDHLLTILPFEPQYFIKEGLASSFIGHPILETPIKIGNKRAFLDKFNLSPEQEIITLLPGSRIGEISRILPIMIETANLIAQQKSNCVFAILALPHTTKLITDLIAGNQKFIIILEQEDRENLFASTILAIAKSGTSTLEIAMAKIPMIVTYKINPLSALLLRMMLLTKYVTLMNIVAQKEIIPELLQENCNPTKLSNIALLYLSDAKLREKQAEECHEVIQKMKGLDSIKPSEKAADIILNILQKT